MYYTRLGKESGVTCEETTVSLTVLDGVKLVSADRATSRDKHCAQPCLQIEIILLKLPSTRAFGLREHAELCQVKQLDMLTVSGKPFKIIFRSVCQHAFNYQDYRFKNRHLCLNNLQPSLKFGTHQSKQLEKRAVFEIYMLFKFLVRCLEAEASSMAAITKIELAQTETA